MICILGGEIFGEGKRGEEESVNVFGEKEKMVAEGEHLFCVIGFIFLVFIYVLYLYFFCYRYVGVAS